VPAALPETAAPAAPVAGPAPLPEDARRALTALLRARARRAPRQLPPRLADAAVLLPVLLQASFERGSLVTDAPGVEGLQYHRRWSGLARSFDLPPPCRAQRGRRLVQGVLAVPAAGGLDALALVAGGLAPEELGAVQERLEAAQALFARTGVTLRAAVFDPARLARDREAAHRVLAFGALLAGRIPPAAWDALAASRRPLPPLTTAALAAGAPAPLATLALTLLARAPCPPPLEAALAALSRGASPLHLADPEVFCLRWAALSPGLGEPLEEAMLLARSRAGAPPELGRLLAIGRALALACARAIRATRLGHFDRFTQRLWREALGPGLPRVLLPPLGRALAAEAEAGRLRLDPERAGRAWEVRTAAGAVLGRGASPVQARLRALDVVATAGAAAGHRGGGPLLGALDATWRDVALRLSRPRDRAALLVVVVAGGAARPGPPADLLNRGPPRSLEFDGALAILVVPGRRAAGRMLSPPAVVDAVLRRAPAGASLDVTAASPSARPVAARLSHIAALLRDPSVEGPVAVEAGGRVLVPHGEGVRAWPLLRFAARPRRYTPDPEAPDISVASGTRPGRRSRSAGLVECRVTALDAGSAALLFADDDGGHLREVAPLAELEVRLDDARAIVRASRPPAALAVRLSDDVERAVRRAGLAGRRVGVRVAGALPRLEVEIAGERFGGANALGWAAAAEALLAAWPPGGEGVVGVDAVTALADGARPPPLLALWAASVARRRLRTRISRAIAAYRGSKAGRREG
jgi:hypothetical protein